MPSITEDDVRSLASLRSEEAPVVSCYLDVDGARRVRPADYERVLEQLVRRARERVNGDGEAVEADLGRVVARVRDGFDRSEVRGVALFACQGLDLFAVHELPVSVRDEIVVNPAPAVGQLELVVQQSEKLAVLAADKQHARVFVFRLGELVEHTERTDDLGRDYDTTGEHDRGGVSEHKEELAHQHLRAAAALLWAVYQDEGFDHVVLAAADPVASELRGLLHPYLEERLRGRLDLTPTASTSEVRRAAIDAERRIERERETERVEQLREAVGAGGRAVAGLEPVLDALADKRVERLFVSDGFTRSGWQCRGCERLAVVGRECRCGDGMAPVDDVVEAAVDAAVTQSAVVDVCDGNADLDVLGRIGALLRY